MAGKIIAFEGIDRSGKETQATILYKRVKEKGINVQLISFPNYSSDSSLLVKKYLKGDFGQKSANINPYAAAMFFALDRFLSLESWYPFYQQGGIVICDRYVSSNVAYQASKIKKKIERNRFLDWITSLEYTKLEAPQATLTFFLDISPYLTCSLGQREKTDIHEKDLDYVEKVYFLYKRMSGKRSWRTICCTQGEVVRSVEDISNDIWKLTEPIL